MQGQRRRVRGWLAAQVAVWISRFTKHLPSAVVPASRPNVGGSPACGALSTAAEEEELTGQRSCLAAEDSTVKAALWASSLTSLFWASLVMLGFFVGLFK